MTRYIQRIRKAGDAGSAIVAAIGVAVVGIALSTIVVSQAIVIMNDAARDRVRTVEIHAAEAALDNTLKLLETETPCAATMSVNEGATAVDVAVAVTYWDASTPRVEVVCDPDTNTLSGTPALAVVTSHATPAALTPAGVRAERKIQATVNLVPKTAPSTGAAIFAGGGGLEASNSGKVEPLDPAYPARVWIEGKDWLCSNSYTITGDIIVTDGSIKLDNTCRVKGDTWSKKNLAGADWGFSANNSAAVEGDVVVYTGGLYATSPGLYFGGDVSVRGNILDTWWWGKFTVVGSLCSGNIGTPCGDLPFYEAKGLAEVLYAPGDWPSSFQAIEGKAAFAADLIAANPGLSTKEKDAITNKPCHLDNQIKTPLQFPSGDRIYNLMNCGDSGFETSNGITFVLNSDVAFFAHQFRTSNSFIMKTGAAGAAHETWFIVPDGDGVLNGVATCDAPGDIMFSNQTDIKSPISLFTYTPCKADISNSTSLIGQIYGGKVKTSNDFTLLYTGMGIPGVDLGGDPTTVEAGYSVEIVHKREITN